MLSLTTTAGLSAQDTKPARETKGDGATVSRGTIFDELSAERPNFSELPAHEQAEAMRKWNEENVGVGIPNAYVRFMERLKKEAQKPIKGSKYIGQWGETPEAKPKLDLAADGTFTWDHGHSKGVGIWREHTEGIVWIGFFRTEKDKEVKEQPLHAQHFCYLKNADSLVLDHIDYTDTYKRHDPTAPKGPTNGEQGGADKPATASKPVSDLKPKSESEKRSQ